MLTDANWYDEWNEMKYMIPNEENTKESKSDSDEMSLLVQRRKVWVNSFGNEIKKSKKNRFQCEICSKVFSWAHTLKRHQLHCGKDDEGPLKCEHCDRGFFRTDKLKDHVIKAHRGKSIKKEFSLTQNHPTRHPRRCKNKRRFKRRTA